MGGRRGIGWEGEGRGEWRVEEGEGEREGRGGLRKGKGRVRISGGRMNKRLGEGGERVQEIVGIRGSGGRV